ncbi:MAG: type II secretion system protein [Phycisphaeraceae bacterium]|nr:type II secretion system protein [Phycisphaeraceae bacterium]
MKTQAAQARRKLAAFTLIEMLVVLVIIGILAAITVAVSAHVMGTGKQRATEQVLRALDQMLTSYQAEKEANPPSEFVDGQGKRFPIIDGRAVVAAPTDAAEPSLALFALAVSDQNRAGDIFKSIDSKFIERVPSITTAWGQPRDSGGTALATVIVKDAFGHPIRFVHPKYDGGYGEYYWLQDGVPTGEPTAADPSGNPLWTNADNPIHPNRNPRTIDGVQVRRSYLPFALRPPGTPVKGSVGDADEGVCPGKRPYFYSVGPDGDPGTRDDNIYVTTPTFPEENAREPNTSGRH